jgi:hypothetical protein
MESQYAARTDKELPVLTRNFVKSVPREELRCRDVAERMVYWCSRSTAHSTLLPNSFESSLHRGSVTPPEATILDVILYSRAQIEKENAAMMDKPSSQPAGDSASSAPKLSKENDSHSAEAGKEWQWGIVSIKPQTVDYELPMNPITIMRNALGVEEGGSGIPLDRAAYLKSVEFWSKNAMVV